MFSFSKVEYLEGHHTEIGRLACAVYTSTGKYDLSLATRLSKIQL